ncbi:MAG: hypothetical protein ABUS47_06945 [Steroidobacter sp.]
MGKNFSPGTHGNRGSVDKIAVIISLQGPQELATPCAPASLQARVHYPWQTHPSHAMDPCFDVSQTGARFPRCSPPEAHQVQLMQRIFQFTNTCRYTCAFAPPV